jgi:hypothetical protein
MTRRPALLAIALGIAIAFAAPAEGHVERYKTKITIKEPTPGNYQGRVLSKRRSCVRRRPVSIWRDVPGPNDEKLQDFRADREGRWEFHFIGESYYVVAKRVVKGSGSHRHICKRDRSPTEGLGG